MFPPPSLFIQATNFGYPIDLDLQVFPERGDCRLIRLTPHGPRTSRFFAKRSPSPPPLPSARNIYWSVAEKKQAKVTLTPTKPPPPPPLSRAGCGNHPPPEEMLRYISPRTEAVLSPPPPFFLHIVVEKPKTQCVFSGARFCKNKNPPKNLRPRGLQRVAKWKRKETFGQKCRWIFFFLRRAERDFHVPANRPEWSQVAFGGVLGEGRKISG